MAALKINTSELGPWAAALFFILFGISLLGVTIGPTILGILAIIAGVCQLIDLK